MSRTAVLRAKVFISEYGPSLVLGFALLGTLLVGLAGWEYANPPTTEVTDQTNQQTIQSELRTSANATGDTSLYEPGTKLVDEPVYLLSAAPSLTLTQRTDVPQGQRVRVEQDILIRYQTSHDGTVFWVESHVLAREKTTTSTGEVVTQTSVDIRDVQSRLDEIRAEVGQAGTVRAQLVVTLSYETSRYTGELSETIPVQLADSWYTIEGSSLKQTHGATVTRRVPIPTRSPLAYAIPGGIGVILLVVAVGIAISYRREFDQRRLEQQLQELRYAEWISTGSVSDSFEKTTVTIDSLEDLVDVAIDTDNRVIHDESRDVYVVIDDSTIYCFAPDGFRFASPG